MSTSELPSSTSISLIERARRLDAAAWEHLCEVYGPLVYRWARAAGLQDEDAADVGQEVFRTVAQRIGSFDAQRPNATFRGWLWTITRNKLGDFIRQSAARPEARGGSAAYGQLLGIADSAPNELSAPNSFDVARSVLHRVLHTLQNDFEDTTWQAFWRTAVGGQSASQVAQEMDMTAPAVRQAKYRVLRRLRTELADELPEQLF